MDSQCSLYKGTSGRSGEAGNRTGVNNICDVGRRLSIPKSTITYWVRAAKEGTLARVDSQGKPMDEEQGEVAQLKREVAELKMKRDFLKKAAAYFAKESTSDTRS